METKSRPRACVWYQGVCYRQCLLREVSLYLRHHSYSGCSLAFPMPITTLLLTWMKCVSLSHQRTHQTARESKYCLMAQVRTAMGTRNILKSPKYSENVATVPWCLPNTVVVIKFCHVFYWSQLLESESSNNIPITGCLQVMITITEKWQNYKLHC